MNNIFLHYFLYGNLYLGLLAVSLVWVTEELFSLPPTPWLKWFVFFSTVLVYNLDRIANLLPDRHSTPERAHFFRENRVVLLLITAASVLPLCWIIWLLPLGSLLWFSPLGVLTLLYLYFYGRRSRSGGQLAWCKPLLLSLVWTTVVMAAPFAATGVAPSRGVAWLWGVRFLQYATNGILFDFRDVEGDIKERKANFVATAGPRLSVFTSLLFSLTAMAMALYGAWQMELPFAILSEIPVSLLYLGITLRVHRQKQAPLKKEIHYATLLDGALFFPAIWVLVLRLWGE